MRPLLIAYWMSRDGCKVQKKKYAVCPGSRALPQRKTTAEDLPLPSSSDLEANQQAAERTGELGFDIDVVFVDLEIENPCTGIDSDVRDR